MKKKGVKATEQVLNRSDVSVDSSDDENMAPSAQVSLVWLYATRCNDPNYATCKLCANNKRISTNNGSTSTLRQHLISKHGKVELIMNNGKKTRSSSSISSTRRQELHTLLINCIVRDGRVFRDFEKPGMKQVLKEAFPGKNNLSMLWRDVRDFI